MKIVFMGTPDFSAKVLEKLNSVYPVYAVVTGLDKPAGRGYKLMPSALKSKAIELDIPVLQFDKVSKEGIDILRQIAPDIIITAAFGQILSDELLAIPFFGVLNVHASLLPKYRGASPIQWAIINGESETGVTIMRTVKEVDAGDVLLQIPVKIGEKETAGELFDKLAETGGKAIVEAVHRIDAEYAVYTPQDASQATHCKMIKKSDGKIDFHKTSRQIDCFVRGMTPWPSAFLIYQNKTLKVFEALDAQDAVSPFHDGGVYCATGTVLKADEKNGLIICCKNGAVRLSSVQYEGGKRMSDCDFLRGHKIEVGYRFD
jgi:methionyl-tRNA formyltransferase